jgi:myosin-light-chain kinase
MTADECLEHRWLSTKREPLNKIQLPTEKLKKFLIRRKWQVSHSHFDSSLYNLLHC